MSVVFERITSTELAQKEFPREQLIQGLLIKGEPAMIAGPAKSLKTVSTVDAAIALATGGRFLGRFETARPLCVAMMFRKQLSAHVAQIANRVCIAAGHTMEETRNLFFLPAVLNSPSQLWLQSLERDLRGMEAEVLFIDTQLLPYADDNTRESALQGVADLCRKLDITPDLVTHAAPREDGQPCQLDDVSCDFAQRYAKQWMLVSRRGTDNSVTADHSIWLHSGGNDGRYSLWSVDLDWDRHYCNVALEEGHAK